MPDLYMDCNLSIIEMPTHTVLAMLALFAYVFVILPHRRRKKDPRDQRDLQQARIAICEMEGVVGEIHRSTASIMPRLKNLQGADCRAREDARAGRRHHLAPAVLRSRERPRPNAEARQRIASAQECIRYHSTNLQRFSEQKTDPLTGVGNRRALESMVAARFTS